MVIRRVTRPCSASPTLLKGNNRSYDLLARYGGEEFALILPQTRVEAAAAVAERFRTAIESATMPCQPLTLSIGRCIL